MESITITINGQPTKGTAAVSPSGERVQIIVVGVLNLEFKTEELKRVVELPPLT